MSNIHHKDVNGLTPESAVALYGITRDESLKQTIQQYYLNECTNVSNLAELVRVAQPQADLIEICLEQAKCFSHDLCPTSARGLEPEVVLQILQPPSQLSGWHASLLVAACCEETCVSLDVFQRLTDASILPTVDPMAAVFLLALECDYGSISRRLPTPCVSSLQSRCIPAISQDWNHVQANIALDTELSKAWDKIPPEVQAQCMLRATTISSQLEEAQDQEEFESLPCVQRVVVEDDSDDCDDDDSVESFQPYAGPKCIPSDIPLKVVPRNGRLGARDELFQGYCLYNSSTDVKPVEPQTTAAIPKLLRSLWENLKLRTTKTIEPQEDTSEPQPVILYTTKLHRESASSA